jgi:1-acyl-sn-glycerol-3-phosphate acyltransferase
MIAKVRRRSTSRSSAGEGSGAFIGNQRRAAIAAANRRAKDTRPAARPRRRDGRLRCINGPSAAAAVKCGVFDRPTMKTTESFPQRLAAAVRGSLASLALFANVLFFCLLMVPFALAKLVLPVGAVRRLTDRALNKIAMTWIGVNNAWIAAAGNRDWDVRGIDGLRRDDWYIVAANHQSWVDILVLQNVFSGRVPMLKFFLKRQLIYVPIIGLAWWALDFPFMQRKGGASSAQDLERARLACEKFRLVPTSVINFLEGTRFTRAKHDAQRSPYRHLLKPRSGGIATALSTLGGHCHRLLDVTIVYPHGAPKFWHLLSGRVDDVIVRVRQREIPADLVSGDYAGDPQFRARMQDWVNALWSEKDDQIERLLPASNSVPASAP